MKKTSTPARKAQPDGEGTVLLRHNFTKDERLDLSSRQNAALNRIGELESKLASVKNDFMSKIQAEDAIVRSIGNHLNSGYELRATRVIVEFHPSESKKFFFDITDKEKKKKLGEDRMTAADHEIEFPFAEAAAPAIAVPDPKKKSSKPDQDSEAQAIEVIRSEGKASATLIMRHLKISFGEADSIMESLVKRGILGDSTGAKGDCEILELPEASK